MPNHNIRKIPKVYGNPKNKEQVFYRVNRATQLPQRICVCPPCPLPGDVTNVVLILPITLLPTDTLTCSWNPSTGASSYNVQLYYGLSSPPTTLLQTYTNVTSPLSMPNITITPNAYYGVVVTAVNSCGEKSSSMVIEQYLNTFDITGLSVGTSGGVPVFFSLGWDTVNGATIYSINMYFTVSSIEPDYFTTPPDWVIPSATSGAPMPIPAVVPPPGTNYIYFLVLASDGITGIRSTWWLSPRSTLYP